MAPPDEPWWTPDMYWPWLVTHRIAPLVAGLDWLLATRTVRGTWRRPLVWLCYPGVVLIFSWVRGALDGWYPYDFLNPGLDGGWPAVIATSALVLAAFLVVGILVHLAGNARVGLARGPGKGIRCPAGSPGWLDAFVTVGSYFRGRAEPEIIRRKSRPV